MSRLDALIEDLTSHRISRRQFMQRAAALGLSLPLLSGGALSAAAQGSGPNKIVWVSPALVFPVMGAMSAFVEQVDGEWRVVKPSLFRPDEMIGRAVSQFRSLGSDPILMGRSAGAYDAVRIYPSTLVEVMREMKSTVAAESSAR